MVCVSVRTHRPGTADIVIYRSAEATWGGPFVYPKRHSSRNAAFPAGWRRRPTNRWHYRSIASPASRFFRREQIIISVKKSSFSIRKSTPEYRLGILWKLINSISFPPKTKTKSRCRLYSVYRAIRTNTSHDVAVISLRSRLVVFTISTVRWFFARCPRFSNSVFHSLSFVSKCKKSTTNMRNGGLKRQKKKRTGTHRCPLRIVFLRWRARKLQKNIRPTVRLQHFFFLLFFSQEN